MSSNPLACITALAMLLGPARGIGAEVDAEDLQRQIEEQNELIRRQSEALEAQSEAMEKMEERLRRLEGEASEASRTEEGAKEPSDASASGPRAHIPGSGFQAAKSEWGTWNFRLFANVRYLNQRGLNDDYRDAFGNTRGVDDRHDVHLNKVNLQNFGWVLDERLEYLLYVWSANTSQGLGAQVVVGGNLKFRFNDFLTLGGGIDALPGTRTTSGSFPFWLGVDQRLIADEFFRPSYTMGILGNGKLLDGLQWRAMLGNNLSQLGVDAGQLDASFDTFSGELSWMPMGDYGRGFGDHEHNQEVVTRLAAHFSYSSEDVQSQPNTNEFDNVTVRFSDGNPIFTPDLFGAGVQIRTADYHMVSVDTGVKYRGFALEGEYFYRWVNDFGGPGTATLPFENLEDHGFQLQASAMVYRRFLQLYLSGSRIFGEYGNPWDARVGLNWFPFGTKTFRWNNEVIYLEDSPVGGLSLPFVVGGEGPVFHSNFELFF